MPRRLVFLLAGPLACSGGDLPSPAPSPTAPARPATSDPPPPVPPPAPPLPGTVRIGRILVQDCAGNACPELLQPLGAAHCGGLALGGLTWRLPTLEEAKSFAGRDALDALAGFHWTGTPFAEDPAQVWIFDPVGGQSTTIPGGRKPFRVRCVTESGSRPSIE